MALRRRGNEYSAYLKSNGAEGIIPYQTWRRWLRQGKITEERLLQLGIDPRPKRRCAAQRKRFSDETLPGPSGLQSSVLATTSHNNQAGPECGLTSFTVDSVHSAATFEEPTEDAVKRQGIPYTTASSSIFGTNTSDPTSEEENIYNNESLQNCFINDMEAESETAETSESEIVGSQCSSSDDENVGENEIKIASILESDKIGVEALNRPLAEGLSVTKFETMLMIFHLALRHSLTDVFLQDLMQFVNEIVGVSNAIPESMYLFRKLFMFGSQPIVHFFCPSCQIYLGTKHSFEENSVMCDKCEWSETVNGLNGGHYFVTLSMRDQLKNVLNRPGTVIKTRKVCLDRSIRDITDGVLYKNQAKEGGILSNPNSLTISISSDGSPVHSNGVNSLWPIHFYINEVDPRQRFDVENILLAGLWFSKGGDPNLQVFLKPLVDELHDLEKTGITWKRSDGNLVRSPVFLLCCCADSVARPKIQCMMQFNGSFGCSYCLHPNTSFVLTEEIKSRSGLTVINEAGRGSDSDSNEDGDERNNTIYRRKKMMRYLVEDSEDFSLRNNNELRSHMKIASQSPLEHIYGAKGVSILCDLPYFDTVFGLPIDYMHSVLLGVVKRSVNLWFDRQNHGEQYYFGLNIDRINRKLAQICTPSDMASPRSMSDRAHWKAKEYRGFLLYYGLPCLLNVISDTYYNNFKKLVTAVHILSRDFMESVEVDEANTLLHEFVWEYQQLYGKKNMVFNVHTLTHLAKTVSKVGPLWAYSMFPFESANGRLIRIVKGTRGIAIQIARKYLMTHTVSKILRGNYMVSDSVLKFCSNVVEYKYLKHSSKLGEITLLGRPSYVKLNGNEIEAFSRQHITLPDIATVYNRAVWNGVLYSSSKSGRQKVYNDSCVRVENSKYLCIDWIIPVSLNNDESEVWCLAKEINIALAASHPMPAHIKQCSLDPFGSIVALPFSSIVKKCVFICCDEDDCYVAEITNCYEKS